MLALTQFIASIKEVRVSLVKSSSVFSSSISTVHQFSSVLISFIHLFIYYNWLFIHFLFLHYKVTVQSIKSKVLRINDTVSCFTLNSLTTRITCAKKSRSLNPLSPMKIPLTQTLGVNEINYNQNKSWDFQYKGQQEYPQRKITKTEENLTHEDQAWERNHGHSEPHRWEARVLSTSYTLFMTIASQMVSNHKEKNGR